MSMVLKKIGGISLCMSVYLLQFSVTNREENSEIASLTKARESSLPPNLPLAGMRKLGFIQVK